ncbi:MAG: hypothetical protein AB1349_08010 [Elusimicrobiota bacterium]
MNNKGQSMTEYVLVLLLCVTVAWVGTRFFQTRLRNVYRSASTSRAGVQGMLP